MIYTIISTSLSLLLQDQIKKEQTPFFFQFSHVVSLNYIWAVIIHRVVAHEDPPFRPNIPSMEMKPEYIELMVDCWDDEPEERPHFYRIVERLKKISGRYRGASARGWGYLTKFYTGSLCLEFKNLPLTLYTFSIDRKSNTCKSLPEKMIPFYTFTSYTLHLFYMSLDWLIP